MYRNLNPERLGIIARQSELIELVLNHHFNGLEIDMSDMVERAEGSNVDSAAAFFKSGGVEVGTFELPVNIGGSEADYRIFLGKIEEFVALCNELSATRAVVTLPPDSDQYSFQEYFEIYRERISSIAAELGKHGIRVGLALQAASDLRDTSNYEFIVKAEQLLALQSTVGNGVGIVLDTWDWFVGGGTVEGLKALTADQIIAVRISDIPAGIELESAQSSDRDLPSPEGQLPLDDVVAHLTEIGFEGPVTIHGGPDTFRGVKRDKTVAKIIAYHEAVENGSAYLPVAEEPTAADSEGESEAEVEEETVNS